MFAALSSQLIRQPTKSSRRSTIAGCRSMASSATPPRSCWRWRAGCRAGVSALQRALELDERLADAVVAAEAQLLPADVADDAAPQRVVEVDARRSLRAAPAHGRDGGDDLVGGDARTPGRRTGSCRGSRAARCRRVVADSTIHRCGIEHEHVGRCRRARPSVAGWPWRAPTRRRPGGRRARPRPRCHGANGPRRDDDAAERRRARRRTVGEAIDLGEQRVLARRPRRRATARTTAASPPGGSTRQRNRALGRRGRAGSATTVSNGASSAASAARSRSRPGASGSIVKSETSSRTGDRCGSPTGTAGRRGGVPPARRRAARRRRRSAREPRRRVRSNPGRDPAGDARPAGSRRHDAAGGDDGAGADRRPGQHRDAAGDPTSSPITIGCGDGAVGVVGRPGLGVGDDAVGTDVDVSPIVTRRGVERRGVVDARARADRDRPPLAGAQLDRPELAREPGPRPHVDEALVDTRSDGRTSPGSTPRQ